LKVKYFCKSFQTIVVSWAQSISFPYSFSCRHVLIHSLTLSLSLSLSHTHTHTHSHTLSHTQTHKQIHSQHTLFLSDTHTYKYTHSSLSHAHTLFGIRIKEKCFVVRSKNVTPKFLKHYTLKKVNTQREHLKDSQPFSPLGLITCQKSRS